MRAVRDGDVTQLGLLFERYHVRLFAYLYRTTGNRTAAEDLVQDVFVRVLKYRATFGDDGRFDTWVFRIARNARNDHFRRVSPDGALDDGALDHPSLEPGPAALLEQGRNADRLRHALSRLRHDRQELIALARFECLKQEQIAEILGISVGAVKVRLHRALLELRDVFHALPEGPT